MKNNKVEMWMEGSPMSGGGLWIDEDYLEDYKNGDGLKWGPWGRPYDGLVLGFGENVFVFSIDASPLLKRGRG